MYGLLLTRFAPKTAAILCAVWYCALIVGVIALSVEPPADFRYARY
ncbi:MULTISPECIES: hypothetical protein [unclassified Roseitalea]|nr:MULTISPECIES: hypothetical protein [unclassified Roseitalea]